MIDDDETDWKVLTIALDDDKAQSPSRNPHSPKTKSQQKKNTHVPKPMYEGLWLLRCRFDEGHRKWWCLSRRGATYVHPTYVHANHDSFLPNKTMPGDNSHYIVASGQTDIDSHQPTAHTMAKSHWTKDCCRCCWLDRLDSTRALRHQATYEVIELDLRDLSLTGGRIRPEEHARPRWCGRALPGNDICFDGLAEDVPCACFRQIRAMKPRSGRWLLFGDLLEEWLPCLFLGGGQWVSRNTQV